MRSLHRVTDCHPCVCRRLRAQDGLDRLAREEGVAGEQLGEDAADAPHVDGRVVPVVLHEQLRRAVPSRHHVPELGIGIGLRLGLGLGLG